LLVSILIILWERGVSVKEPLRLAIFGYSLWVLTYIPDVVNWFSQGTPSITGSMKAESPFIEFVREFFGLLLCLGACIYYARKERRERRIRTNKYI